MNTAPTDVFALAEKRLAWIGQRQDVLAQNIANANTPGYAARDIKPFGDVLAAEARRVASGRPGFTQVLASGTETGRGAAPVDRTVNERAMDGNAVALDEQLQKVAETDTAHQLAMNLYKKYANLFKTALGRA